VCVCACVRAWRACVIERAKQRRSCWKYILGFDCRSPCHKTEAYKPIWWPRRERERAEEDPNLSHVPLFMNRAQNQLTKARFVHQPQLLKRKARRRGLEPNLWAPAKNPVQTAHAFQSPSVVHTSRSVMHTSPSVINISSSLMHTSPSVINTLPSVMHACFTLCDTCILHPVWCTLHTV